jgi:hypothetical protein
MHKLDIDFQSAPGKAPSAGMILLVLAVLGGLALVQVQRDLGNQLAAMDAAQGRSAAGEKLGAANQKKSDGDQAAQTAFNQLTLPWGEVFAAVEEAADKQVLLLALEGDGRNRVIKITAQAPHVEDMLAYLGRLKSNGKLGGWRLLSHREDDKGALHFVIQAVLPEGG